MVSRDCLMLTKNKRTIIHSKPRFEVHIWKTSVWRVTSPNTLPVTINPDKNRDTLPLDVNGGNWDSELHETDFDALYDIISNMVGW